MIRIQFMERVGLSTPKVTFIGVPYRLHSYIRRMTKGAEQIEHFYEIEVPHEECFIDLKPLGSQVVIYLKDGKAHIRTFEQHNPPSDHWLAQRISEVPVKDRDYVNAWIA